MPEETEPLKVLAVIPGSAAGNSMIFCKNQITDLEREGIKMAVFYLQSRTNPYILAKEFIRFNRFRKLVVPDIIHAYYGTVTAFFCCLAAAVNRLQLIITFHGSDLNPTGKIDGFWRDLIGRILSHGAAFFASHIICVSAPLQDKLWVKRQKISILPMGIDISVFKPINKEEARDRLGWSMKKKIILFNNGNNQKIKRLDLAEEVYRKVKNTMPDTEMKILTGHIPYHDMPLYLCASDCLLLTSDSEGSPTIVKEAVVSGLPVVTADVGDVKWQLAEVTQSFICKRDTNLLFETVARVLKTSQRSNGSIFSYRFDSKTIARKIAEIYRSIIPKN